MYLDHPNGLYVVQSASKYRLISKQTLFILHYHMGFEYNYIDVVLKGRNI